MADTRWMRDFKWDFRTALEAARELKGNPDNLAQVFTVLEALSGGTYSRTARRMAASESGRRLLENRPDIVQQLADRTALAALPEGSLGRTYLQFVESEKISADGIRMAEKEGHVRGLKLSPELAFVQSRLRDTHDLWHSVTGYRGDVLGEIALLGFTLAQTRNPGVALIILVGMGRVRTIPGALSLVTEGFRRGRAAAYLPAVEWEALLDQPVAQVRARLGVSAPPKYEPVRTADLRQMGLIPA